MRLLKRAPPPKPVRGARKAPQRTAASRAGGKTAAARTPPPRRRPRSRLQRAAILWGSLLVVLAGVTSGGVWLVRSGWVERMLVEAEHRLFAAAASANLTLRSIQVEGRHETPPEAILAALQVVNGDPILSADPAEIKARLVRLTWVKSASVERRLPDTLYLRIEEHAPLAIWQHERRLMLISGGGEEIEPPRPHDFARYLLVVGEDAPAHAAALLDLLAKAPALAERVTAAVRVGGRRWNLRLDNRVDVKLPEEGALAAWLRLARLERQHGLLERDLLSIDLRLPDRLVVRLTPEAAEIYHAPKNST
jgi:cell division protein FtsQ